MTPLCTLLKSGSDVLVQTFTVLVYRSSFLGYVMQLKGIMWKIVKIQLSEYIIRKAKVLAKGKGILCSPNPKPENPCSRLLPVRASCFHNPGTIMTRCDQYYPPVAVLPSGKPLYSICKKAEWTVSEVWKREKPTTSRNRNRNLPFRSQLTYQLSYAAIIYSQIQRGIKRYTQNKVPTPHSIALTRHELKFQFDCRHYDLCRHIRDHMERGFPSWNASTAPFVCVPVHQQRTCYYRSSKASLVAFMHCTDTCKGTTEPRYARVAVFKRSAYRYTTALFFAPDGCSAAFQHSQQPVAYSATRRLQERHTCYVVHVDTRPFEMEVISHPAVHSGYNFDIVYSQKPRNIDDLREKITQAFPQITPLMLQRTWAELHHRYELCRISFKPQVGNHCRRELQIKKCKVGAPVMAMFLIWPPPPISFLSSSRDDIFPMNTMHQKEQLH
ncbi:hypothetical protein ANN_19766 [Periplaneta americana]|uniref:Uncharacterized protein n=1 Tax=Periplaneta americana TaxID=6978 RepID=A0ABQ8SAS2_PERAM|nr:hypothetical protein ANN_19766 [Periplaneta americana]